MADTWRAVVNGDSGIDRITSFDTSGLPVSIAGEIQGIGTHAILADQRVRGTSRVIKLAVVAALEAVADAGIDMACQPHRVGVLIGSGMGGFDVIIEESRRLAERGARAVRPTAIAYAIPDMPAGIVSMITGAAGPNFAISSACSSGAHSIGEAAEWIRRGDADVVIAGGTEAPVQPLGIAGFAAARALSRYDGEPQLASRPFDRDRTGFVMSEGASIVVLENLDHAVARGASIYAEVAGYGATSDAFHVTRPNGDGARRCVERAIAAANCKPADIGYINAHGTSTPVNDAVEAEAYRAIFGDDASTLSVSSTKSTTGHLLGAAGALEVAITAKAIQTGVLPPTINLDNLDPECGGLDHIRGRARNQRVAVALTSSFGFGGHNACLLLVDPDRR
jgi:3-oxoacyl-[acyl-carrier-protein] synthase II